MMNKALRYLLPRQIEEAAAQEERNRLARDLHDSIKQQLFSINVGAATAQERWSRDPEGAQAALTDVRRSAREAMVEMQALLHQLRPEALTYTGLVEALREQCEALGYRTGAEVTLELGEPVPEDQLQLGTAMALFRIAQEALANVARHARARKIQVWLGRDAGTARIWVRDDGQGFEAGPERSGMGLRNLQERAKALRGHATVASEPGVGTTVDIWIPLASARERKQPYEAVLSLSVGAVFWLFRPFKEAGSLELLASSLVFFVILMAVAWKTRSEARRAVEAASGRGQESLLRQRFVSHGVGALASFLAAGWVPWSWRQGEVWGGWAVAGIAVALACLGYACTQVIELHQASEGRRRWWWVSRFKPAGWEWIPLVVLGYAALFGLFLSGSKSWDQWLQGVGILEAAYLVLGGSLLAYLRSRRPPTKGAAA